MFNVFSYVLLYISCNFAVFSGMLCALVAFGVAPLIFFLIFLCFDVFLFICYISFNFLGFSHVVIFFLIFLCIFV